MKFQTKPGRVQVLHGVLLVPSFDLSIVSWPAICMTHTFMGGGEYIGVWSRGNNMAERAPCMSFEADSATRLFALGRAPRPVFFRDVLKGGGGALPRFDIPPLEQDRVDGSPQVRLADFRVLRVVADSGWRNSTMMAGTVVSA